MLNEEEHKKMLIANKSKITIRRKVGKYGYTASGYGMFSTASSEEEAELDLLRKVILQLEGIIESLK